MSYNPASILTSGALPNLAAIYYERGEVKNLKATTPFLSQTKSKPIPLNSGPTIQFYTYALLGANTNQAAEGTVGSPISESTTKITATIGQYCDFINCSDLSMDVAIDEGGLLKNLTTELGYRLGLTLNSIVQTTADSAVAVDSSVNVLLTAGSFVTAATIRSVSQSLAGINARPFNADGTYGGVIHPTVVRDILNDTANNGLTDILKRGPEGRQMLMAPLANEDVIEFAGVRFKQTTTCPNVQVSAATNYETYIFGEDAIFSVSLGAASDLGGKDGQSFKLMVQEAPSNGSVSDPARQIGGWCSYNSRFTTTLRPGSTMTLRRIQAQTSAS